MPGYEPTQFPRWLPGPTISTEMSKIDVSMDIYTQIRDVSNVCQHVSAWWPLDT